jgi:hypothetical protein
MAVIRHLAVMALLFATSCGSGAGNAPTEVWYVSDLGDNVFGQSNWDDDGSSIQIVRDGTPFNWAVLAHEVWHLFVREEGHFNPRPCISFANSVSFAPPPSPCPEEVAQVNADGRTIRLHFPEDQQAARDAADFWNDALGRVAIEVVD